MAKTESPIMAFPVRNDAIVQSATEVTIKTPVGMLVGDLLFLVVRSFSREKRIHLPGWCLYSHVRNKRGGMDTIYHRTVDGNDPAVYSIPTRGRVEIELRRYTKMEATDG